MTQLEEFRSQLAEGDDPAARERARRRLRAAQAGAGGRRSRGPTPARAARRRRHGGAGDRAGRGADRRRRGRRRGSDGIGPAPASARALLVRAAESAAEVRDGGIARIPRPDEYFYLEIRGTYRDGGAGVGDPTTLNTRTYRRWLSLTRPGRIETSLASPSGQRAEVPDATGRLHMFIGNERFSAAELAAFDPTPRELYRRLLDGVSPGQGSSPEAEVFVQIVDALRDTPLPPRLRATFLRALAEIPGLVLTGPTKDSLGRPASASRTSSARARISAMRSCSARTARCWPSARRRRTANCSRTR